MPTGAWEGSLPRLASAGGGGAGLICARLRVHTGVWSPPREHRALHTWELSPHAHVCVSASLCVRAP